MESGKSDLKIRQRRSSAQSSFTPMEFQVVNFQLSMGSLAWSRVCWLASWCPIQIYLSPSLPSLLPGEADTYRLAPCWVWLMENDGRRSGKEKEFEVLSAPGSPLPSSHPPTPAATMGLPLTIWVPLPVKGKKSASPSIQLYLMSFPSPFRLWGGKCTLVVIPRHCTFLCGFPISHSLSFLV